MTGRRVLLLLSNSTKKYFIIIPMVALVTILISAVIFANTDRSPLEGRSIVIDPGHGGIDPGTNDNRSFMEKDINLQIALKLKDILVSKGAKVELTRNSDISLDKRNNLSSSRHRRDLLARVMQFNSGKYDLFISIHVNYSSHSRAIGPLTLYLNNFPSSGVLASSLQDSLNLHMKEHLKLNTSRKPVKSSYFILKYANIPGAIVETGYISNPTDKKLLKDKSYQSKLALAMSRGIAAYFENVESSEGENQEEAAPTLPAPEDEDSVPSNVIDGVQMVRN